MAEDTGKKTGKENATPDDDAEIDKVDLSFMTEALNTEDMSHEEKIRVGRVDGFEDEEVIDENHADFWKGDSIAETIELTKERDRLVAEGKLTPYQNSELSDEDKETKRLEAEAETKRLAEEGKTPEEIETARLAAEDLLSDEDKEKLRVKREAEAEADAAKAKKPTEFKYIDPIEEGADDEAAKKAREEAADKEKQRLADEAKAKEDPFLKTDEDKAFVEGLNEDDAETLDMARFAEGFKDKYKGRFNDTLKFLKEKASKEKKHAEENPDELPDDNQALQDWIGKNEPKLGRAEARKINKEMFIAEALERGKAQSEAALAGATEEIHRLKSQPKVDQEYATYHAEAQTVVPQDMRDVYDKAKAEGKTDQEAGVILGEVFGADTQITARAFENAQVLGSEFIRMVNGVIDYDPKNGTHAEINKRITDYGKQIAARAADPEKAKTLTLEDGRVFVERNKFLQMDKTEKAKHWSLSNKQILKLFVSQETRTANELLDASRTKKYDAEVLFAKKHNVDASKISKPRLSTDKPATKKAAAKKVAKHKAPTPPKPGEEEVSPKSTVSRQSGDHNITHQSENATAIGAYMQPGMTHDTTPKD